MATRSTIKFIEHNKIIASIYKHWDGYIENLGIEIAEFLKDKKIICGISNQTMEQGYANGMGCLAAQFIKHIKEKIGDVYMANSDCYDEEYNYKISHNGEDFIIEVNDIFKGTPQQLLTFKEEE